jgi:hypothetical protein
MSAYGIGVYVKDKIEYFDCTKDTAYILCRLFFCLTERFLEVVGGVF